MTIVNLLREAPQQSDSGIGSGAPWRNNGPSFGSELRALLASARTGTVNATAPEDGWLVLRIEEALRGLDDIQQMATSDEPAPSTNVGVTGRSASIRAQRARAAC